MVQAETSKQLQAVGPMGAAQQQLQMAGRHHQTMALDQATMMLDQATMMLDQATMVLDQATRNLQQLRSAGRGQGSSTR